MRDQYYWGVWVEIVAKRGCEVYAESATVGEANELSGTDMRRKWAKNSSKKTTFRILRCFLWKSRQLLGKWFASVH